MRLASLDVRAGNRARIGEPRRGPAVARADEAMPSIADEERAAHGPRPARETRCDFRRAYLAAALFAAATAIAGCASQQCDFHSQCGTKHYCMNGHCLQDCRQDYDCAGGQVCNEIGQCSAPYDAGMRDGGPPVTYDAGPIDPGHDSGPPGVDSGPPRVDSGPPRVDSGPPPTPDAGPPPLGHYLDRCSTDSECATGHCVDDVGGTRMCTITCSGHSECASEHVCASGLCRHDDTGQTCSGASGCVLSLCAGNPATGSGACTRPCNSASDCPAGYACSDAGGVNICVNIEIPCAQCSTGLCATPQGCTAACRTAADCPRTLSGMAYTCTGGQCTPSSFILGSSPIGASCPTATGATNDCRSGACLPLPSGTGMCTEVCTEAGGCGPGFGCGPVDGGSSGILLLCLHAGSGAIGSSCTTGGQCDSGICDPGGYCTRLCTSDARCPSDMHCMAGTGGISSCVR